MKIKLIGVLVILSVVILATMGCGSNNGKVAGIYGIYGMTITLANDGSATLEIPYIPGTHFNLEGETDHGSFSYNGKVVILKWAGKRADEIYQVAGNNLIDNQGDVWKKR